MASGTSFSKHNDQRDNDNPNDYDDEEDYRNYDEEEDDPEVKFNREKLEFHVRERELLDKVTMLEQTLHNVTLKISNSATPRVTINPDPVLLPQTPTTHFNPTNNSTPNNAYQNHTSAANSRRSSGGRSPNDNKNYRDKPLMWRETFGKDTEGNINDYLRRFEHYASTRDWTDAAQVSSFICTLEGRAAFMVRDLPIGTTWLEIRERIIQEWEPPGQKHVLREKLATRARHPKESADKYLRILQDLASRAYGNESISSQKDHVFRAFIDGQPENIADALYMTEFRDVNHALAQVEKFESRPIRRKRAHAAKVHVETPDNYDRFETASTVSTNSDREEPIRTIVDETPDIWVRRTMSLIDTDDEGYYEEQELYTLLRITSAPNDKLSEKFICFYCRKPGHRWGKCFRLRDVLIKNGMKDIRDSSNRYSRPKYDPRNNGNKGPPEIADKPTPKPTSEN